jgi:hypothetical protein
MPSTPSKRTAKIVKATPAPKPKRDTKAKTSTREDSPDYSAVPTRFIDLFCGIGGFRIAFERAGGRCVFSSDYDKFSQQTYKANFGERPHGDIHTVAVADIPAHDILCAGFPCQPFSIAGVSKKLSLGRKHGFEDVKQGNLFFSILDFHRPAAFVLENVKNLKGHDGGKTFDIIFRTLTEHLGYTVYHKIIDARSVVPSTASASSSSASVSGAYALRKIVARCCERNANSGNQEPELVVESDESTVESRIVQAREAKTVANIKPLRDMRAPRENVRRNQQLAHGQFRDAAAPTEVVQHGIAEILLTTPKFYVRGRLGRPVRQAFPHSHAFFWEHFEFAALVGTEQFSQRAFTCRNRLVEVGVKLIPYHAVQRARTLQTFEAT